MFFENVLQYTQSDSTIITKRSSNDPKSPTDTETDPKLTPKSPQSDPKRKPICRNCSQSNPKVPAKPPSNANSNEGRPTKTSNYQRATSDERGATIAVRRVPIPGPARNSEMRATSEDERRAMSTERRATSDKWKKSAEAAVAHKFQLSLACLMCVLLVVCDYCSPDVSIACLMCLSLA